MFLKKTAESQFLLAFFSFTVLISCSGYQVTVSDLPKDYKYTYLFQNTRQHISFYSYGGRHLSRRPFFHRYGTLVFTYCDKLRENKKSKGNEVYYSLFIIREIPEKILLKNDTLIARLYDKKVLCFGEHYSKGKKKIYKRYFVSGNKNYLFMGEYKRFYKDRDAVYWYHMSQEMEGLEL